MTSAVVWLRSDLRATWHSPLDYAIDNHDSVVAVYCLTMQQWQHYGWAACRINLILQRLAALEAELAKRQVPLIIINADTFANSPDALTQFVAGVNAEAIYFNAEYELDERKRDKQLKQLLPENITAGMFHDTCLINPATLKNKQGSPFKVFTPYFKTWLDAAFQTPVHLNAPSKARRSITVNNDACGQYSILTPGELKVFLIDEELEQKWPSDEEHVQLQVGTFIRERVADYGEARDYPATEGTSKISPYLSIGAISVKQLFIQLLQENAEGIRNMDGSGEYIWLKELAWRDFYRYVMFHFPHVCQDLPFLRQYKYFPWNQSPNLFDAWCKGKTGYPLVDAAMRCLVATGWMHNRLRMVVANFLSKDLLLSWQQGEAFFMAHLIDGDFASNNGGWQWSASVGTDAAPYFRVFNPVSQSQKFDPSGEFIRRWIPELASLSAKQIHEPWKYADVIKLGYVTPIVDHRLASAECKNRFKHWLEHQKALASV